MDVKLESLKIRAEIATETLLSHAVTLRRCADRVIASVESGNLKTLNSLGEIQGLGDRVDVSCAEVATLLSIIKELEEASAK